MSESKTSVAQVQADIQRAEAKRMLNAAFGLPEDIRSNAVDCAVECIIGAAILEVAGMIEAAAAEKNQR